MRICKCGKPAVAVMDVPTNAFTRLMQITEQEDVCRYHADKAQKKGIRIERISGMTEEDERELAEEERREDEERKYDCLMV